jgi:hypothetical protein
VTVHYSRVRTPKADQGFGYFPQAETHLNPAGHSGRVFYVQDERYFAIEHKDKVRPHSGREGGLGHAGGRATQSSRRGAACVSFALHISEAFQALAVQKLPVTG